MINKKIINDLQIAIKQLGLDIKTLNQKMSQAPYDIQELAKSYERDMSDRWKLISDIVNELEVENDNN